MNTKDLYRKIRRGAGAAALLLATLLTGACNDDDTSTGSPYFRLENVVVSSKMVTSSSELGFDVEAMVGDPTLELIRYDIRSNCDWTVEANSTDADWLLIWPDHGSGDGKVRFCVTDNDNPDPRATTVVFRYADGRQTEATLAVKQAANVPHITISVNNSLTNEIVAGRYAQSYDISVNANVDFFYSLEKNDWAKTMKLPLKSGKRNSRAKKWAGKSGKRRRRFLRGKRRKAAVGSKPRKLPV